MINLTDIKKIYIMGTQEVHALRGVTITIEEGEFVAIIGASGSGKSTLMNIIGCLDVPTEGSYILNGKDVSDLSDDAQARIRNKEIGFIFQRFNLLARTDALKQVAMPLMYGGIGRKERKERAMQALESVGLGDRADHRPDELSGGQQQRVAIARALVTNPSLLLADEPTGALDTVSGADVLQLFKELHASGKTIVMVTHDLDVAAHAERIIRLSDGAVISDERKTQPPEPLADETRFAPELTGESA
ncbi:MAG TPA: ABC transporter ATP-binding protein [Anaerolineae bacterium]|nr:ABC transporter ATP-binding protein [Anaerolineae bacterium]